MRGDSIVVALDMCSSSDVIEELTLRGDLKRLQNFLTTLKEYLASAQKRVVFDPYKFTGDGWILLFLPTPKGTHWWRSFTTFAFSSGESFGSR
jgi:hypothetical protein